MENRMILDGNDLNELATFRNPKLVYYTLWVLDRIVNTQPESGDDIFLFRHGFKEKAKEEGMLSDSDFSHDYQRFELLFATVSMRVGLYQD